MFSKLLAFLGPIIESVAIYFILLRGFKIKKYYNAMQFFQHILCLLLCKSLKILNLFIPASSWQRQTLRALLVNILCISTFKTHIFRFLKSCTAYLYPILLWPRSCWPSSQIGNLVQPTQKLFNSAYLQNKFCICRKIPNNT